MRLFGWFRRAPQDQTANVERWSWLGERRILKNGAGIPIPFRGLG